MRLATPTPKTRPKRRNRYAVSPRLWVTLFVSSVVVHLVFIGVVQSLFGQVSTKHDLAPIDVELLSEEELATESQPSRPATRSTPSPNPAVPNPSPNPVPDSQPDTSVEPDNTIASQPPPTKEPSPAPIPPPPSPTSTEPDPPPPSPTDEETNPPTKPSTQSGEPSTSSTQLPAPGLPSASNMPPGAPLDGEPSDGLGTITVNRNPTPATFSFQIGTEPSLRDRPDILAEIQGGNSGNLTSDPSGCLLPPDVEVAFYGQPVTLRVEVDAIGNLIDEPEVVEPSGKDGYDKLAKCVVKTRQFTPGKDIKDGVEVPRSSDLMLRVIIQN